MEQPHSSQGKPARPQYFAIDIAKFVFAFIVVAAHMYPFRSYTSDADFLLVQGIARVVVPFFFLTAAFLFFSRMKPPLSKKWQDAGYLWKYVERIGIMYFFWTLLINGLLALGWLVNGIQPGVFQLSRSFLLSAGYPFLVTHTGVNAFRVWQNGVLQWSGVRDYVYHLVQPFNQYHLWYFPALMLGMILIYEMLKRIKPWVVILIGAALFLLGSPADAYYGVTAYLPVVRLWANQYLALFYTTRNGVFYAILYLAIGAYFAWFPVWVKPALARNVFWITFLAMLMESQVLKSFAIQRDYNFYFFSIPSAIFLFLWLREVSLKPRWIYQWFREASILIYCSHGIFVILVPAIMGILGWQQESFNSMLRFWLVYFCTVGFAALVLWLEKKPIFRWLQFLH